MPHRIENRYISLREVARIKDCSLRAVINAVRDGHLKSITIYGPKWRAVATGVLFSDIENWKPRPRGRPRIPWLRRRRKR